LAPKLSPEQTQALSDRVVAALAREQQGLSSLVSTLGPFAPKLTAKQAGSALDAVMGTFPMLVDGELDGFEKAAPALAAKLTAGQCQATLSQVLRILSGTTSPEALWALVQLMVAFPVQLGDEQVQVALDAILRVLKRPNDDQGVWSLASSLAAIAPKLTEEQTQFALEGVFGALKKPNEEHVGRVLALAVQALPKTDFSKQSQSKGCGLFGTWCCIKR
jgi:hypothetical protein